MMCLGVIISWWVYIQFWSDKKVVLADIMIVGAGSSDKDTHIARTPNKLRNVRDVEHVIASNEI